MASKGKSANFIGSLTKGGLHRTTNTPMGQKVPASKVAAAAAGKYGPKGVKQANLAKTLSALRPK